MQCSKLDKKITFLACAGVSLIELLIGTLLATLIIAMCVQSFQTTRYTDSISRATNEIQTQGRFGLSAIQYGIEHAGFHGELGMSAVTDTFPASSGFAEGQVIQITEDAKKNAVLRLRINGDARIKIFDCSGAVISETDVSVQRYFLNENNQLICIRENISSLESVLAQGVKAFQIILGRDTDDDQNIDQYISPTDLAPFFQSNVLIAEINMLLSSETPVYNQNKEESFDLLNDVSFSVNDRFLHRQIKDVFIVKNADF